MWMVKMLNVNEIIFDWTKNPVGKIDKGRYSEHCGRFNSRNMTVTIIGLKENKILLINRKRDPEAGAWAMPGGYLDWNETLKQCGIREFKEETGMDVTKLTFLGVYDSLNRDKDGRQNVDHCFIGQVPQDQPAHQNLDEVTKMQWFSFDQLPENIAFDHRDMINDYLLSTRD